MQHQTGHQTEEHDGVKLRPAIVKVHIAAANFDLAGHLDAEDGSHKQVNDKGDHRQVQVRKGLEGVAGVH